MSESSIPSHSSSEKVELSIHIDSELLDQIKHLTNDPSKVIETAIKQWLRGERREEDQAMSLRRTPPVPPRGEWNDWGELARDGAHKSAGCEILILQQISWRKLQVVSERTTVTHNLRTIQGEGKNTPASLRFKLFATSNLGRFFKVDR